MCDDFYDDFDCDDSGDFSDGGDFDDGGEDIFDDKYDCETGPEGFEDIPSTETPHEADSGFFDEFSDQDAFYAGTLIGFAYEEGLIEGRKRRDERDKKKKT